MQPRCVVHTYIWAVSTIKQLQSFERLWASPWVERRDSWQVNCWYWISRAHFTRNPTSGVCVSLHQCLPWSAVMQWGGLHNRCCFVILGHRTMAYQIVVGSGMAVVCPVLGMITEKSIGPIPIPPNTGKYWLIPQYRYHSNLSLGLIVETLNIGHGFPHWSLGLKSWDCKSCSWSWTVDALYDLGLGLEEAISSPSVFLLHHLQAQ